MSLLLWQCAIASSTSALKAPIIELSDISIDKIAFAAAQFTIQLEVYNPNKQDIVVESVNYQLALNKIDVKKGEIQQREIFPAQSKRLVNVSLALPYDAQLPHVLSVIQQPRSSHYDIKGAVKIQGEHKPFFFEHSGPLTIPGVAGK